ncbi:hypothetical protein ACEPPN_006747 [Leptodophora sp. 'Broadleaf-Isolate-01']
MTQEQAEAWADSLPVPTLSVANPASTPASQTYNPQLLSTTPLSQYAPSYELESPDLGSSDPYIYLSGQPIAGKALMHPQPPTSWPPFGKRETKVAYCNHVGPAGQEDDTSPNKQGTADLTDERLSEIDKVRIPLSLKRHRMLPQPVPSWVATWKELKQWVSDDSNLPPEALRAVIKAQKLHYSQLTRKVPFASQARQGVPQMPPPGIAFPIVPMSQSSMRISNSNISTGSSLEGHSSAQENDKLQGRIPSGNLAEASDEMTRQALDQVQRQQTQQQLHMHMASQRQEQPPQWMRQPQRSMGPSSHDASASLTVAHHGDIVYINNPGHFGSVHPQPQTVQPSLMGIPGGATTLPMITLAPEQAEMRLKDFSNIQRPRDEITGPAYQDRTQTSPPQELLMQAHHTAEHNKSVNLQRTRSSKHLDQRWKQRHEGSAISQLQSYRTQISTQARTTPPDEATQLWWKALRKLDEEDHGAAECLTAALKRTTRFNVAESLDSKSCQFVKDDLENYTTILRYFADIAILIARYSVLESTYQQWSGMSLDPDYEKAIVDLCVLFLAYIARFLNSEEAGSSRAQALDSQMGKIAEADAICRGFTVTFPIHRKVEDLSEDDSDSDDTVTDIKAMKRSFSDVSDDITKPASIKTLVHENNDTSLPVAEVVASKRIRN